MHDDQRTSREWRVRRQRSKTGYAGGYAVAAEGPQSQRGNVTTRPPALALAGEGNKVVWPSHWSECGQTMGQETTFEVFAKRPAIIGMTGVIVPLPFKLLRSGTFESCLEVLGNR